MGHAEIDNDSGFVFEPQFVADTEGRPLLVAVLKATFDIASDGTLTPAPEQAPLAVDGERWDVAPNNPDEPASYRLEPEVAWPKPATDVVFLGHAHAPTVGTRVLDVGVQIGPLSKIGRVFGDRVWVRTAGEMAATRPLPFEKMPLVYERAFGGWSNGDCDRRNPAGVGFGPADRSPLPNIEDPRAPISSPRDRPAPVGFGFTGAHWKPRAGFAGTFDARWEATRKPLLPDDFDRRFFNAASAGLVATGHLRGDERVAVRGLVPRGSLTFDLPGVPPAMLRVSLVSGPDVARTMALDTVVVDLDLDRLYLLWRTELVLARGPHDVRAMEIRRWQ